MRDPDSGALAWQGFVLAGLSAVAMAAYLLLSRALAPALGHSGLACGLVVAAGLGVPAGLGSSGFDIFQPSVLMIGAVVALLSAVIPYSLEMAALTRLPASTVAVLLCLEPVVAAGAGLIVLGETLSVQRWAGMCCICAATAAATVRNARERAVVSGSDDFR
ncbi:EamA family transporter [Nocardia carnea]|uniref:EamA family transporter n=1 Tax=Nocardia carnea TaxID=37328 RepID=UPI0024546421|nr:EamA family transporter [Nocardia carnea]